MCLSFPHRRSAKRRPPSTQVRRDAAAFPRRPRRPLVCVWYRDPKEAWLKPQTQQKVDFKPHPRCPAFLGPLSEGEGQGNSGDAASRSVMSAEVLPWGVQTQILAPGLKCEENEERKENLRLMNRLYWHKSAFIRLFFQRPLDAASQHKRMERMSLFRLKWVSSEIMNMSLRKTKSPTKQAARLQRQQRWQIIVFKSGTAL